MLAVLYVRLGSSVTPKSFGGLFMGSVFICRYRLILYSAGSGVNSVHVVLSGLSMRLLSCVHLCICCRYETDVCMFRPHFC